MQILDLCYSDVYLLHFVSLILCIHYIWYLCHSDYVCITFDEAGFTAFFLFQCCGLL